MEATKHRRKPHQKSRKGCVECKQKHIKCSESLPRCQSCVRLELPCSRSEPIGMRKPPASSPACSQTTSQHGTPFEDRSPLIVPSVATPTPLNTTPNSNPNPNPIVPSRPPLPTVGSNVLAIDQLELLHHWTVRTSATLGTMPPFFHLWSEKFVTMGLQNTYLLSGILGLAAVHKATLVSGNERQRYIYLATEHMNRGLEVYRSLITMVESDAFTPVFAFGCILSIYHLAFAQVQEPPDLIVYVADWMGLIKGIGAMIAPHWHILRESEIGILILDATRTDPNGTAAANVDLSNLDEARTALRYMPSRTDQEAEEKTACQDGLDKLGEIYSHVKTPLSDRRQSPLAVVMSWPAHVSARFRTLLVERHPAALALLEQWVGLFEYTETVWWTAEWLHRVRAAIR